MADMIAIVGDSGTGKSYSLRNLDPEETIVVSVAHKMLPFRGSKKNYKTGENFFYPGMEHPTKGTQTALGAVKWAYSIAAKNDKIRQVVIDDARYLMSFKFMKVKNEPGYDKFGKVADEGYYPLHWAQMLKPANPECIVIFLYHASDLDEQNNKRRIRTSGGKLVDNHIGLDGLFTIELFTHVTHDKEKDETSFYFMTRDGDKTVAKAPPGMFSDKFIPNDMKQVLEKVRGFLYGTSEPAEKPKAVKTAESTK